MGNGGARARVEMAPSYRVPEASGLALPSRYGRFTAAPRCRTLNRWTVLASSARSRSSAPTSASSPPGAKERAILARLLVDAGRTVPADALLDAAWDDVPRDAAARSLAVRIANLRSFLEPGRERGAPSSLLVRDGHGYRLAVAPRPGRRAAASSARSAPRPELAPAAALDAYDARARAVARAALRRAGRRGVHAGRDPAARGAPLRGRGGPRRRARGPRPRRGGGARAAAARRSASRCARSWSAR